MKIKDIALSAAYVGQRVVKAICVGAQEVWSAVKYIVFKDPAVEQICATNFGDGSGLSEEDAANVTSIGTVFQGNTEIISFDELSEFENVSIIPSYAFSGCTNLQSINLSNVVNVGYGAFQDDINLKNIGNLLKCTTIPQNAFNKCSNLNIHLDAPNVTSILAGAFSYSGILSVNLPSLATLEGCFNSCKKLIEVKSLGHATAVGGFGYCTELLSVVLPQECTKLENSAFSECGKLESVNLPQDLTTFGSHAFYNCKSLIIEDVNLPNLQTMTGEWTFAYTKVKKVSNLGSIPKIVSTAFYACKELSMVNIPATCTEISTNAFNSCSTLSEVIVNNATPPTLASNSFSGTPSDMSIYVPDQSVTAYREASGWSAYADRIKPLSQYVEQ